MGGGCQCDDYSCDQEGFGAEVEPTTTLSAPEDETERIVFVDKISDLDVIQNEVVQLAVWRRKAVAGAPKFTSKLQDPSIAPSGLPSFEGVVTCDNVRQKLTARLCPRWRLRSKTSRALSDDETRDFIDDIANLVQVFANIYLNLMPCT